MKRAGRWILRLAALIVLGVAATLVSCRWQAARREAHARLEVAPSYGRFVHAGDVEAFIQELGPPKGPVVLFVHGMGAWSELWRPQLVAAAAAGFRAVALDLPPFGYSERPQPPVYGRQQQARRILGVIDALGADPVSLVGHSFGGGPTMEAVLLAPRRVRSLVLANAAIGLDVPPGSSGLAGVVLGLRPIRNTLVSATITNPRLTRRLLTQFVARPGAVTDAHVGVLQAPLEVEGGTDAFGDWLIDFLTTRETTLSQRPAAYAALSLPALVIWGDRDSTTPLPQGRRLAQVIPGAELAIMPGIGHMPQIEDPAQFNRLVIEFLRRRRPR